MKEQLKELFKNALIDGLELVQASLTGVNLNNRGWSVDKYDEFPTMRYLDSGLPSFHLSKYEKNDYGRFFNKKETKVEEIESWSNYHVFITGSEKFQRFYEIGEFAEGPAKVDNELWSQLFTYFQLADFVDRYLHLNDENAEFIEELFDRQFENWFCSINNEDLEIEVYVPIVLLKFDFEEVKMNDRISIKKMEGELQLARNQETSYTDSSNPIVAGAATHALVFKNWSVKNSTYGSREKILNDISAYTPILELAEKFFSSLRICTGVYSGFSQIVGKAVNWEDKTNGDLAHVDVVSIRKYPDFFDNFGWLSTPPSLQENDVKSVFQLLEKINDNKFNGINLALSRLNRAYLRSREEDTILDITIALETSLTHDSRSEITFRLASRVAALCSIRPFKEYSQYEVFEFCKKIYNYRSAVIHGNTKEINRSRIIKFKEKKEIQIIQLSIELLRHVLNILLDNPEFNEPKEIDKLKFKNESNKGS